MIGRIVGYLKVVSDTGKYATMPNGRRHKIYLCSCSCGNTIELNSARIGEGKRKSCGCRILKSNPSDDPFKAEWQEFPKMYRT